MNPSLEKQAVQSGGTTKQKGLLARAFAIREFSLLIIIIACAILLSFLTPHFLTVPNLTTTAIGLAADGIIAVGMTVALVLGGFDLSVGSGDGFKRGSCGFPLPGGRKYLVGSGDRPAYGYDLWLD